VYENLVAMAASAVEMARLWVWPAAAVAGASLALCAVLRLWACGPGLRMAGRARSTEATGERPGLGRRVGAGLLRGFVALVGGVSGVCGKVAVAAALVACVGLLPANLLTPASAGAGEPTLALAQQALKRAIPTEYAKVVDLRSPRVTREGAVTTYTFSVPAKGAGKPARAKTYAVTVGPDGVRVGNAP
jgi:hypothetical protein